METLFSSPERVFTAAVLLRITLFFYGLWQDANSPMKYTDIDYMVFTDASRFLSHSQSPYSRETYRYTPLLAYILLPTTFSPPWLWFSFGKCLFAISDIVTGYLILRILLSEYKMSMPHALKYSSIWLLNPFVATISTRGSSEGLLAVTTVALLWAVVRKRVVVAGLLLGLGVHFKIYPFIYAPSIIWWMDDEHLGIVGKRSSKDMGSLNLKDLTRDFLNASRLKLAVVSLLTFLGLNVLMYSMYGWPFLQHTYLHHITRIDHRHNFSPYNILLYLNSSNPAPSSLRLESLAFIPQILLSAVLIPLILAKKDLPSTMLAQTFAFVTFNKVCTSQYFLWYMVFLPFYLPNSSLMSSPKLGWSVLGLWAATQGLWLQQGFQLEFMGKSTFFPGLWVASLLFFITNVWILGIIVQDVGLGARGDVVEVGTAVGFDDIQEKGKGVHK